MSQSYNISTSYNALDDTVYDIFDMDAYCSSLSPSVPSAESVPDTPTPTPRLKRYPKTHGHPRLSPAVVPPPVVTAASALASTSSISATKPSKPDKGKGREHATITPSPSGPMGTPSSSIPPASTTSVSITPEQHSCLVRVLKHLNEWLAQGWQPGVDESHLRHLAEIFNAAEAVAEGSLSNIHRADLAWRLADSEGWEKSAGSSIMGAIDIQVTVTQILYKDYGDSLITSFRSFLGQKEAELGSEGRPSGISGPSLQKETDPRNPRPDVPKRVQFEEVDRSSGGARDICAEWNEGSRSLIGPAAPIIPSYDETCATLSQHLAFVSGTARFEWLDFLLTLRNQLRYLLMGRGQVPDTHPLGAYRCF